MIRGNFIPNSCRTTKQRRCILRKRPKPSPNQRDQVRPFLRCSIRPRSLASQLIRRPRRVWQNRWTALDLIFTLRKRIVAGTENLNGKPGTFRPTMIPVLQNGWSLTSRVTEVRSGRPRHFHASIPGPFRRSAHALSRPVWLLTL